VHATVVERVTDAAEALGLRRLAMTPSAITGATGNQEFFLHLRLAPR
jgi:predicted rRNA methylase YqxC with S4 and FtsJ domains